jgi:glycosyltransferase involved in cell wall biosynthesis
MVTRDRRSFVSQSIKYYQQQDHPDRELIVIDDGEDEIADLIPSDPAIRYVRLDRRLSVGAKRNLGCELARGEFIAHWDDDDWMARRRLSYQLRSLQQDQADVCGVDRPLFSTVRLDRAWQYVYPGGSRRWLSGASLLYKKDIWRTTPFSDVDVGEDALFLWSMTSQRLLTLADNTFHIAFIHAGNVSPKRVTDPWWHVYAPSEIKRLIDDDQDFYLNKFA